MNTLTSDESDYHNGDYDDEEDDEEDKDDDEEDKDKDDEDKNKDYEDQDEDKDYEDNKDDDMFGSQGEIKAPSDLDSRLQRCLGDAKSFVSDRDDARKNRSLPWPDSRSAQNSACAMAQGC